MIRAFMFAALLMAALPAAHAQDAPGAAPAAEAAAPAEAPAPAATAEQTGPDTLPLGGIAAIVNDQPISYSDVVERAQLLLLGFGSQPTQEQIQQITGRALEQLID
ncbi:MAG: hypothetical protein AAF253_11425, partial [Pseudomonadota bacterium]